jgi:Xaa-Pro aminopeptidase
MNKRKASYLSIIIILVTALLYANQTVADTEAIKSKILPLRQRAIIQNEWLKWRFENILPKIMKDSGINLWLIINREYVEDPLFYTLVPQPATSSYRTTILILHDKGGNLGVERLSASDHQMNRWYKNIWIDKSKGQFENLAEQIKKINPKKIGIDISENWHLADGLNSTMKKRLENALGPKLSKRLVSAEKLCVDWLQIRSPQEIKEYKNICNITHDIIREISSDKVIKPDVTTIDDLKWQMRQTISDLGLEPPFHPLIDILRSKKDAERYKDDPNIIRRGDLIHCDMGARYLGLNTDMQWHIYVCREGESDTPEGLKKALEKTIEFGKILTGEFREGRTGEEITKAAMAKAKAAGIKPTAYSHSIGTYNHSAGVRLETRPKEDAGVGSYERTYYKIPLNTVYAIEFQCLFNIPEWDNKEVQIGFEDEAALTKDGCKFLDGYIDKFLLIK